MQMTSLVPCPGCGAMLPDEGLPPHDRSTASGECWLRYGELALYTLAHDPIAFIHQHAVDAYAAQHSGSWTKPIATYFALMGLYLYLEHGCSGRDVQRAHMHVGRAKVEWPRFTRPESAGPLTVLDVLRQPEGDERDAALHDWAAAVWAAWEHEHARVREHTDRALAGFHLRS